MTSRSALETLLAELRRTQRNDPFEKIPLKHLANLLRPLFRDPPKELKDRLDGLWSFARRSGSPIASALAPARHSSNRRKREIWWLQMLVAVVQGYSSRRCWIVPKKFDRRVTSAQATVKAAHAAWDRIRRNRGSAVLGDLIDAIEILLDCLPNGLTLDGRFLVNDGVRIGRAMTPKEALLMKLLIDADGQVVSKDTFRKRGIGGLDVLKSRFLAKPKFSFLEDHIVSVAGSGYQLIP